MSKNLKKILVAGASLLMFASVGAGISGNTNSASANVALTSESQYRKIRGARVIATRPHGSRRPFGDNTTLGYVRGNSVIVNGNGEVTRIDGRHATRSLFDRVFYGSHSSRTHAHRESQATKRRIAQLRRQLRDGKRKLHKYNEMDKKHDEALKGYRKSVRQVRQLGMSWQKPIFNPSDYKGKVTNFYTAHHHLAYTSPYSGYDMKNLLTQYSRNTGLKSLAGMWHVTSGDNSYVNSTVSFKPISRRTVKSLTNPHSVNQLKRTVRIINQLRSGTVRQTGQNRYVVSLEPKSHGQLHITRSHNTLKLQNYLKGKEVSTDYAHKENPRTKVAKNAYNIMWRYIPYGYFNDLVYATLTGKY